MGGRGSLGGTRSTYRGNSTLLFQQQALGSGDGSSAGGANTKTKREKKTAGTGGIQGSGKGGDGGSAVEPPKVVVEEPTTDIDTQPQDPMTDEELYRLFARSDIYKEYLAKDYRSDAAEEKAHDAAYTKWIQSQEAGKPAPSGSGTPVPTFRRKDSSDRANQALIDDIEAVNPRYDGDDDYGTGEYSKNCQRCVVAVEMRAKGYDVTAQSLAEGWRRRGYESDGKIRESTVSFNEIATMWSDEDGNKRSWSQTTTGDNRFKQLAQLNAALTGMPEGARGFIGIDYTRGGSHIFNWEIRDGQPYFIDGQTDIHGPEMFTANDAAYNWKANFNSATEIYYMRVDDMSPNEKALTWVRERSIEEKNAPTATELGAWLDQAYPPNMPGLSAEQIEYLQEAFSEGWQAVRTGQTPVMPPEYADTPIVIQAWEAGINWARRPA